MDAHIERVPIMNAVNILANMVTLGKYERNKKLHNIDTFFHLYLILKIENQYNGQQRFIRLEKHDRVRASELPSYTPASDSIYINFRNRNLNMFINSAEHYGNKRTENHFWIYDAVLYNCQGFVTDCLLGNRVPKGAWYNFVNQSVASAVSPLLQKVMRGVTDLTAKLNIILYGRGIRRN